MSKALDRWVDAKGMLSPEWEYFTQLLTSSYGISSTKTNKGYESNAFETKLEIRFQDALILYYNVWQTW